jgi:hypothetical protein
LQLLHMCFQVFYVLLQVFQTYVASVSAISDVCYKCFIWCFKSRSGCSTCCNVSHLPQPPTEVAGASCMRVGNGGRWWQWRRRSCVRAGSKESITGMEGSVATWSADTNVRMWAFVHTYGR